MKKIALLKIMLLLSLITICSCKLFNNTNESTTSFEAGWWKFSTLNPVQNQYIKYNYDKQILRLGNDLSEKSKLEIELINQSGESDWDVLLNNSDDDEINFIKIQNSELPNWAKEIDGENTSDDMYILLPKTASGYVNNLNTLYYSDYGNIKDDDLIEVKIIKNENNINVTANAYSSNITIKGDKEGVVVIKVINKVTNYSSSECEYTFVKTITSNTQQDNMIVGKWKTSENKTYNIFIFYSDGTGRDCMNSNELSYITFNWKIENNILIISGNIQYNSMYTLTFDSLYFDGVTYYKIN